MTLELGLFILVAWIFLVAPPLIVLDRVMNSDGEFSVKWRAEARRDGKARKRA